MEFHSISVKIDMELDTTVLSWGQGISYDGTHKRYIYLKTIFFQTKHLPNVFYITSNVSTQYGGYVT